MSRVGSGSTKFLTTPRRLFARSKSKASSGSVKPAMKAVASMREWRYFALRGHCNRRLPNDNRTIKVGRLVDLTRSKNVVVSHTALCKPLITLRNTQLVMDHSWMFDENSHCHIPREPKFLASLRR